MAKTYFRMTLVFVLLLSLFLIGTVRISVINSDSKIAANLENNTLLVTVSNNRGRIFDCNGTLLTGVKQENIAVITPTPRTVMYCSTVFSGEEKANILSTLRNGKPAIVKTDEIYSADIINVKVPVMNRDDGFCSHLLGYTDAALSGVSGIQKAMEEYLKSDEKITVRYACDATGRVLSGIEPEINGDTLSTSGVLLTIDSNVQVAAENAAKNLNKGAIVISEAGTGKIRAMVSKPSFNANDISSALNEKDSPLLNRALTGYNVGSAFKPCVALSNAFTNEQIQCTGKLVIDSKTFLCHDLSGHGNMNLGTALINSCNCYFYRFALMMGGDKLYEMATVFSFGYPKQLCEGITTVNESLPGREALSNNHALANFSIGQGQLLASPVSMLCLYEAIACDGVYHQPKIVEGIMKNAVVERYENSPATKAVSKESANRIKEYLKEVVISGTGKNAYSEKVSVAGKTATAQTGWLNENGQAQEHSWFCGFFPADNPEYIAIVLVEDSGNSNSSATEIFRYIAEALTP